MRRYSEVTGVVTLKINSPTTIKGVKRLAASVTRSIYYSPYDKTKTALQFKFALISNFKSSPKFNAYIISSYNNNSAVHTTENKKSVVFSDCFQQSSILLIPISCAHSSRKRMQQSKKRKKSRFFGF